jgi:hypothetical protein
MGRCWKYEINLSNYIFLPRFLKFPFYMPIHISENATPPKRQTQSKDEDAKSPAYSPRAKVAGPPRWSGKEAQYNRLNGEDHDGRRRGFKPL